MGEKFNLPKKTPDPHFWLSYKQINLTYPPFPLRITTTP